MPCCVGSETPCQHTLCPRCPALHRPPAPVPGIFTVNIEGELKYTDSSRNGTWYVKNGDKQPTATLKESSQIMQKGDALLLGHTCIRVKSISREAARSSTPTGPSVGVPASAAAAGPTLRAGIDDGKAKRVYDHPFTRLFREASAGKALFLAATADHTQHG